MSASRTAASIDHWDHPRSVAGVAVLVDYAVSEGVSVQTCLVDTAISVSTLQDWSAVVEAQQEIAVIRNVLRALGNQPGRGVEVGSRYHLTTFGIFGYALLSCTTFDEAVRVGLDYISLSFAFTEMTVETVQSIQTVIRLAAPRVPSDLRRFLVERDMAAAVTMYRQMASDRYPGSLREVRLGFPAAGADSYRHHFGVQPTFDCAHSELIFHPGGLSAPLPQANRHTMQECVALCEQIKTRRLRSVGVAATLRARLFEQGGIDRGLDVEAAAELMTPRTFRRRLAAEGTGYREIVDDVRRSIALDMILVQRLAPVVVAESLGYQDVTSFLRALRRWRGAGSDTVPGVASGPDN